MVVDFYDIEVNNLKRVFLKFLIKFNYWIFLKYNLKWRIVYYGYKVCFYWGIDFVVSIGIFILVIFDGIVIKVECCGGNGIYVKIRYNEIYEI